MDLDIEMDVDDVQDMSVPTVPEGYTNDIITGEEQEPGEVDEPNNNQANGSAAADTEVVPYKVHIHGLDTFNPDDVKNYLAEHYSTSQLNRVEWIDDSSANYIFKSEAIAQEALVALAAVEIADATQLPPLEEIPAKPFSQKPECPLRIRFAVTSDKKAPNAAVRSRFYLLHPEYDPEERRRRGEWRDRDRERYRDRRDGRDRRDRRRDRRSKEREDEELETYEASMYDDDASALAKRASSRRLSHARRRSRSRGSSTGRDSSHSRRNREKELFPDRFGGSGRLRDRSASPPRERDRDRDATMDLDQDEDARTAASLRNREKSRAIKERLLRESRDNGVKELFPEKLQKGTKELFPEKLGSVGGKAAMDQVTETTKVTSAKLADRITAPPSSSSDNGSTELHIRGMASKQAPDKGFRIKGASGTTVKELFPEKIGNNAGKELFAEKLEGRNKKRQKAEDLFY